jgi:hypothetical protein
LPETRGEDILGALEGDSNVADGEGWVYKLGDPNGPAAEPESPLLWHIPIRVDVQGEVPGDWQGSVSEWVAAQARAHVASVTLSIDQFQSLFSAQAVGSEAPPAAGSLTHEAFALAPAAFAAENVGDVLLPAHASGDLHSLLDFVHPAIA